VGHELKPALAFARAGFFFARDRKNPPPVFAGGGLFQDRLVKD
jgi:hypothetical protein